MEGGEPVPPAGWREYRRKRDFLGPGCLCPLLQPSTEEPVFTEAVMHFKMSGEYFAHYVAECAQARCGYLGECSLSTQGLQRASRYSPIPVSLEMAYLTPGHPSRTYPFRGKRR